VALPTTLTQRSLSRTWVFILKQPASKIQVHSVYCAAPAHWSISAIIIIYTRCTHSSAISNYCQSSVLTCNQPDAVCIPHLFVVKCHSTCRLRSPPFNHQQSVWGVVSTACVIFLASSMLRSHFTSLCTVMFGVCALKFSPSYTIQGGSAKTLACLKAEKIVLGCMQHCSAIKHQLKQITCKQWYCWAACSTALRSNTSLHNWLIRSGSAEFPAALLCYRTVPWITGLDHRGIAKQFIVQTYQQAQKAH